MLGMEASIWHLLGKRSTGVTLPALFPVPQERAQPGPSSFWLRQPQTPTMSGWSYTSRPAPQRLVQDCPPPRDRYLGGSCQETWPPSGSGVCAGQWARCCWRPLLGRGWPRLHLQTSLTWRQTEAWLPKGQHAADSSNTGRADAGLTKLLTLDRPEPVVSLTHA